MQQINKLTLLGMSGIGKTHLAAILSKEQEWFHYSADYRIGSQYLNDEILQNVVSYMQGDNYLQTLLIKKSITVENNISVDNLSSVANFLGKVGNPNFGGLPLGEFNRRQKLHLQAEKNTMLDVDKFIDKAKNMGIDNFINDAGGSLCELDDEAIYQYLSDRTLIVYIKASEKTKNELVKRAVKKPKPLYYNPVFFAKQLQIYLTNNNLEYAAQINPDDFVSFIFPYLVEYRTPKYQRIADKYGVTIDSDALYLCQNNADFFNLIDQQCQ